ncbi:GDP-mannose 4,6-dehydratase [Clostridium tyrobutyricum]|uniref:GDP-mannose 4,6-dehydratase n=1 Tax=Clostridium tyrobutyricum TaxID=1519 RepID=UPI001C38E4B5|nr:GDP-mannose 4,6-dehydratase [Clostridium tyrobutyricum]MBV4427539.1 GDP-mannose 4,6-dehydratase [Clostridium tyrobutyricum]MBV4442724.1 GDP-mannose 4,6-dehydratase [Clostridium tyrobutyricum]
MKILITGGCGFIGSHVADRFYKEGHKIYIIDNLSTGNIENVEVPHKFYNLNIASKDCEEIFKSNRFDAVINLSAQVDVKTSIESPFVDSKSNLLGITNMLDLSHRYGVKRFIFASSAAVYGNTDKIPIKEDNLINPIAPYGMSKYVGEFYCRKWFEIYGLKTMCFRFSNVFGPRQGLKGESGVMSIFMNKVMENKELTVFGNGEQTRDFIYVEDVADGIYKAFESDYTGVLNLSTNTQYTLNELIDILRQFHKIKKVTYKENRPGDIRDSRLDNTRVKKILGWNPKYSFKEGVEKTYRWYNKYHDNESYEDDKEVIEAKKESKKSLWLKYMPYIENILGIVMVAFLNSYVLKNDDLSSSNFMDICYIYIVVISVVYGMKQSIISVVFSLGLYMYLLVEYGGYNIITIFYEPGSLIHIASYIIIGMISGYISDVNKRKLFLNKLKFDSIKEKYNLLELIYDETRSIKEELEDQVVNSENSFVSIYNATKALDSFEINDIYDGAIMTIEKLLKTSKVSIYSLSRDGKYLRLKSKSSSENFSLPYSINLDEFQEIKDVINNKVVFANKRLNDNLPIMIAPVVNGNKTIAVVSIHEFKFENLTLYYENLFRVLVELISNAIAKAYKYDEAVMVDKYIPNTEILVEKEFKKVLSNKIKNRKISGIDFTLVKVMNRIGSYEEIFPKLAVSIRDDDLIGIGDDDIYLVLSNTNEVKAKKALDRLSLNGIKTNVMGEIDYHV